MAISFRSRTYTLLLVFAAIAIVTGCFIGWQTSAQRRGTVERRSESGGDLVAATQNAPLVTFTQQGSKLVGTGAIGASSIQQGISVALSADGNTAVVGGIGDNANIGAAWFYTRSGGVWTQQGTKKVGTGNQGASSQQGYGVSISADGNTAIVGGNADNSSVGAAWVYTRSGGVWTQQGAKLVGTGAVGTSNQGISVALSGDGNTAIVGGYQDNSFAGAAWVYTRSGGVWTQQGAKLVGTAVGLAGQGRSVALSFDGNTAIVGGSSDNANAGAAFVFLRTAGVWAQQTKLVGTGATGTTSEQGYSVSLSSDGNTAMIGGYADNSLAGAAWVFTRSGTVWTQQGAKLFGTGASGAAQQGNFVSLSADGNTAIVGGSGDNSNVGAAWVWARSAGVWTQQGSKLVGTGNTGGSLQGHSVSMSGDGTTAMLGGLGDNTNFGAAWPFTSGAAPAGGALEFSSATYGTGEAAVQASPGVVRTGGSTGAVSVNYATVAGGTATGGAVCGAGVDYVNASGTLNWANGDSSGQSFNIQICDDAVVDGDKTINLALNTPTGGATLGAQNTAVLTVLDDDAAGPVTVTATAGTLGPTSYATLKAAFDAINAGTHQGAVTVSITANTNEGSTPATLNSTGAGAASYTSVLVRPTADGVLVLGNPASGLGVIQLNGADNVTIDGDNPNTGGTNRNLTVTNANANSLTFGIVIRVALNTTDVASADTITIKNLVLLGNAPGRNIAAATSTAGTENNTYGILATAGASGGTTAPTAIASLTTTIGSPATASNLTVQNNSFNSMARAVAVQGSANTVFPGLLIVNNLIGNSSAGAADQVYSMGVTVQGSTNAIVRGNTAYVESFLPTGIRALDAGGVNATGSSATTFEKNKVLRVRNNNTQTFGAYGINLNGDNNHVVQNNFVADVRNDQTAGTGAFSTTFGAMGIRVALGTGHKIYHNSVNLFGVLPGAVSTDLTTAFAIVGTSQTGVDVRNNIFSNLTTGGNPTSPNTRHVGVFLPSSGTSAMNLTWNNNDYLEGTDANSRMAQVGTTAGSGEFTAANFDPTVTTPATNFRSYTSTLSAAGTNDNASKKVNPLFVSNTDLHIGAGSPMIDAGVTVGVADDIDGDTRPLGAGVEIGADERLSAGGASCSENFDGVTAPALPAGWSSTGSGSLPAWVTSATSPSSAPNDAFAPSATTVGDTALISRQYIVPAAGGQLAFKNLYNTWAGHDGMVLEISINGNPYKDIITDGRTFGTGGYTGVLIAGGFGSAIAGRDAWSGVSGGVAGSPAYIDTTVNFPATGISQIIRLKWRMVTNNDSQQPTGPIGVRIDTITLPCTSTTAAKVDVSGRVTTADGAGLRNAMVTMRDSNGNVRTATTGAFGYYTFTEVEQGSYVIGVASKRYNFTSRTVNVNDTLTDVDFMANF